MSLPTSFMLWFCHVILFPAAILWFLIQMWNEKNKITLRQGLCVRYRNVMQFYMASTLYTFLRIAWLNMFLFLSFLIQSLMLSFVGLGYLFKLCVLNEIHKIHNNNILLDTGTLEIQHWKDYIILRCKKGILNVSILSQVKVILF